MRTVRVAWVAAAALWMVVYNPVGVAAPSTPADDAEVVERLPQRLVGAQALREERLQRQRLKAEPTQLPLALAEARAAIERARRFGDPRELGHAQAALAPWWTQATPEPSVQLLRATVRQSRHEFEAALADLDALLQPGRSAPLVVQAQAELTRATVFQVTGRTVQAAQACERLAGATYAALGDAVLLPARVCLAEMAALRGESRADAALQALAARAAGTPDAAWVALVRAEHAARNGQADAGTLFREALGGAVVGSPNAADPTGAPAPVYPLAAYADWLLDQGRPADVSTLLQGREDADALLLRLAIAWRRTGDARAAQAIATLEARFEAARRRGDALHEREMALAALHLRDDPTLALQHASRNWQAQKEPADAQLLLRAARAAGQPAAAQPLQDFAAEQGWKGPWLSAATSAATPPAGSVIKPASPRSPT